MVAGGNAAARGSKAASNMYQKHGPQILEKAGQARDFAAGYGMPPSQPTTFSGAYGSILGAQEASIKVSGAEVRRAFQGAWNEALHPRNPYTGEFVDK